MPLFKYVGGHIHSLLRNNELKVTPPSEFDDPFEFCPQCAKATGADCSKMLDYVVNMMGRAEVERRLSAGGVSSADVRKILEHPSSLAALADHLELVAQDHVREHQARTSREFGVVCFTENDNDVLMWSWYGNNHKGALIEFNSEELERGWGTKAIKVDYGKERPLFKMPMSDPEFAAHALETVRRKSDMWALQREWRALCPLSACRTGNSDGQALWLRKLPEQAITRVVLGMRFPETQVNSIAHINKQRRYPAKLQRARMDDNEFKLKINDLV